MRTLDKLQNLLDQLRNDQDNRLFASGLTREEFMARPEEKEVTAQIDNYSRLLAMSLTLKF